MVSLRFASMTFLDAPRFNLSNDDYTDCENLSLTANMVAEQNFMESISTVSLHEGLLPVIKPSFP